MVTIDPRRRHVPCRGCTACCRQDVVVLIPEDGDRIEDYETVPFNVTNVGVMHRLAKTPDGKRCVYLGDQGCTIHDRAPAMCKAFDCRSFYLRWVAKYPDRNQRRHLINKKGSTISKPVLDAGRKLIREEERDA